MTTLLLTTNPGLEDLVAAEFAERAAARGVAIDAAELRPRNLFGRVRVHPRSDVAEAWELARGMRSVHHVLQPLEDVDLDPEGPLESIRRAVAGLEAPALRTARTFRITGQRTGEHDFGSPDVEREAGTVVLQQHPHLTVDLERYDLNLRLDVVHRTCTIGIQLTDDPLSLRQRYAYRPRTALKATVAWAVLRLAGVDGTTRAILDPFCGSGTVVLEALDLWPGLHAYASDGDGRAVDGVQGNLAEAGVAERATVRHGDARELAALWSDRRPDVIVTNPPYGLRLGRKIRFRAFYRQLLGQCEELLEPGGRLVLLARRRGELTQAVRDRGTFRSVHVRVVETGNTFPAIFVLERS